MATNSGSLTIVDECFIPLKMLSVIFKANFQIRGVIVSQVIHKKASVDHMCPIMNL